MIARLIAGMALVVFGVAACAAKPATPSPPMSLWGPIITLAQAEQTDAPAMWVGTTSVRAAWIGADDSGVHQDMRNFSANGLSERVVLPLLPVHPHAQQVALAQNDNLHLLWLDDNPQGETHVYDAEISAKLEVERGPTLVTDQSARRFTTIPGDADTLWVISSGGLEAEPSLYIRAVDSAGRPRLADHYELVTDADWPTVAQRNNGVIDVYWIANSDGRVFRAGLVNGKLENPQPITTTVSLNPGDRLETFNAGLDTSYAYLFWNITRADGQAETWLTSAPLDDTNWKPAARLGVEPAPTSIFETGFNSGSAQAAQTGLGRLAWAKPLTGQFDTLPVGGALDKTRLGVVYFKEGAIVGYQDIAPITGLLGVPNLLTDRDRYLYLAWAEPTAEGYANLNLTMTRR